MELASRNLEERASWLVSLRWLACLGVLLAVWVSGPWLGLLPRPGPLLAVAAGIAAYNLVFFLLGRGREGPIRPERGRDLLLAQVVLDLLALTLLLWLSDLPRNPFILFYVFHIILASILLPGRTPFVLAALASLLAGGVLLAQGLGLIPAWTLRAGPALESPPGPARLAGAFVALASALVGTAVFTTLASRYMSRFRQKLRQHGKMLGIGQLLAGFAHQIANPVDGLKNGLRRLKEEPAGGPALAAAAAQMENALQRIEKVARRIQEFARPQGIRLGAFPAEPAVEGALQLLHGSLAARGIRVRQEADRVPPAWGDQDAVQEVVFNLVTNAMDAMPDGGDLVLRIRRVDRPGLHPEGCVAVEVCDNGVGIPADGLERVFEPFYTTKAQNGGTGLGLGLCRMLLAEMGGRIEVESQAGRGSTFRVLLGAAPAEGEADAGARGR